MNTHESRIDSTTEEKNSADLFRYICNLGVLNRFEIIPILEDVSRFYKEELRKNLAVRTYKFDDGSKVVVSVRSTIELEAEVLKR